MPRSLSSSRLLATLFLLAVFVCHGLGLAAYAAQPAQGPHRIAAEGVPASHPAPATDINCCRVPVAHEATLAAAGQTLKADATSVALPAPLPPPEAAQAPAPATLALHAPYRASLVQQSVLIRI